jgi:pimeloyl-ACP methyl ester carboxylesterase
MAAPGCAALKHSCTLWENGWNGFTTPDDKQKSGLAYEYEPGKIPVICIHGLLSHSMTWDETIRSLEADENLANRYQFWTYTYPTGTSYLLAAAQLRSELAATRRHLDPEQRDPALREIVLVGHSMGGMIAKLQVARSGNELWDTVSDRPIGEIMVDPDDRSRLAHVVFFEPQPYVKRVVFIATPHLGSRWTERPLAHLARSFVQFPHEMNESYRQWLWENKSALPGAPPNIPTSIDHLAPDSPVLRATTRMSLTHNVWLHSIIGIGYWLPDWSRGDGIVAINSAQLSGVASEIRVRSTHSKVHRHPETVAELKRILKEHLAEMDGRPPRNPQHGATPENPSAYRHAVKQR